MPRGALAVVDRRPAYQARSVARSRAGRPADGPQLGALRRGGPGRSRRDHSGSESVGTTAHNLLRGLRMTPRTAPQLFALIIAFCLSGPAAASAAAPREATVESRELALPSSVSDLPTHTTCAQTNDAVRVGGQALEGQLNANEASAEQWDLLPGIGPTTAARILEYVRRHPIRHPSQLMRVKGIGRKTYERIRQYLVLQGPTTLQPAAGA